jgi:hypothetical protein
VGRDLGIVGSQLFPQPLLSGTLRRVQSSYLSTLAGRCTKT